MHLWSCDTVHLKIELAYISNIIIIIVLFSLLGVWSFLSLQEKPVRLLLVFMKLITCTCMKIGVQFFIHGKKPITTGMSIRQCLKLTVVHMPKTSKISQKIVKFWVSHSHGWVKVLVCGPCLTFVKSARTM